MRLIVGLLVAAMTANGQAIFGSIQGSVADESGTVLPNTRVTVRNVNTGVAVTIESNDSGRYFAGELRPGQYDVEAEKTGFQKLVQRGVPLRVEDRLRLDIVMKVIAELFPHSRRRLSRRSTLAPTGAGPNTFFAVQEILPGAVAKIAP